VLGADRFNGQHELTRMALLAQSDALGNMREHVFCEVLASQPLAFKAGPAGEAFPYCT